MKRSSSTVTLGAVAGMLVTVLSGCSLFDGRSAESQAVPNSVSHSAPAPESTGGGSPAAAASIVPTPSPTASPGAPVPPSVPGYTLTTASSAPVQRKFQAVAGQYKGVFSGLTARTVVKGKQQVGSVVLLGLHPDLVGNTKVEQRLVPGMIKGMSGQGAKVTQQKVGGRSLAVATTKATNIVAWYNKGTVVLVLGNGTNPAASLAFAKAYLAAS